MENALLDFLGNSYTAYHVTENAKKLLLANGFEALEESKDWALEKGGKYFIERGGSAFIAFTVGDVSELSYKLVVSHTDFPALKIKENVSLKSANCLKLDAEPYGGGIWYSFFDRPLKLAGRIVKKTENGIVVETYVSPFNVCIPSLAIHQNAKVNESFAVEYQKDFQPILALTVNGEEKCSFLSEDVISYDLYAVNGQTPTHFGVNDEFLLSPRVDNLVSVRSSLQALLSGECGDGVCMAVCLDNEEVGNNSAQGADGNFLENILRRIAYALGKDELGYYRALSHSFLISSDVAHAIHPNHPEKSDLNNKTLLGEGVVIKHNADLGYITSAFSSGVLKYIFEKAGVKYQDFYKKTGARSGKTLGAAVAMHTGITAVDIGLAQLAMHSSCECFAESDYTELVKGMTAFYSCKIRKSEQGVTIE